MSVRNEDIFVVFYFVRASEKSEGGMKGNTKRYERREN